MMGWRKECRASGSDKREQIVDWWYAMRRRSPLLRKSTSLLKQIPRFTKRLRGGQPEFSVLANSFPKSGTHLLVQVLEALPDVANYDSFIASVPPILLRERSPKAIRRRIGWIAPGELVSAHLYYDADAVSLLETKRAMRFFIYRDLRDVVVSEAHYLTHMNRWHRAHRYFASKLRSMDDRIMTAIVGIPDGEVDYEYPDVGSRFAPYAGWLNQPDCCCVRFEDLAGPRRRETITRMASFFVEHSNVDASPTALAAAAEANIDPGRSRTFRKGRVGGWSGVLTERHLEAMRDVAGPLMEKLGYEPVDAVGKLPRR